MCSTSGWLRCARHDVMNFRDLGGSLAHQQPPTGGGLGGWVISPSFLRQYAAGCPRAYLAGGGRRGRPPATAVLVHRQLIED